MNSRQLIQGILGGLAGGLVFGIMMGMMGMLPMIGAMVGQPSAMVGFIIHMANSAIIGAAFVLLFGRRVTGVRSGVSSGAIYGMIWWVLGPLTLMPLFMGMGLGVNWSLDAAIKMMPSLVGHLIYGVILGAVFALLSHRALLKVGTKAV